MPTRKPASRPTSAHRPTTPRIPGLTGTMKPKKLSALLDKWAAENDPEEDARVLKALEEEFAAARR